MKTLYVECNMGAAGDMLMAALLELLPEKEAFLDKINALGLDGVSVSAEPSVKCGIIGTHVSVKINGAEEWETDFGAAGHKHDNHMHEHERSHGHEHHEHSNEYSHRHTGIKDIGEILSGLKISADVKKNALAIYNIIAEAESHAHGIPVTEVHFHEVGNLDAVADIVGVCLLIEELAPKRILASPVCTGSGFTRCTHGVLPVPAPATAYILTGVLSYSGSIKGELCTPTGAAILKHFADDFGPTPEMKVSKIGYGMGKKDFEAANCVRVFLGDVGEGGAPNGQAAELSCNVDDMTGEAVGFACRLLLDEGAMDVFTTSAGMKKGRPGTVITCICDVEKADKFAALILKHTTTFGVRKAVLRRYMLNRSIETEQTAFGEVRVKTGKCYGVEKSKLEYEDVVLLAREQNCSIGEMERRIWNDLNIRRDEQA